MEANFLKNKYISVIVPIYNVEKYLSKCLNSLANQSASTDDYEVLLINDGSTDRSGIIAENFSVKHKNFYVIQTQNHGQAHARNIGLDISRGSYLTFVDSDDWVSKEFIANLKQSIGESDMVIFNYESVFKNYSRTVFLGTGITNSLSTPCAKLFRKSLWSGIRFPENMWYEDLGVIPAVTALAQNKKKVNSTIYFYREKRPGSQTVSVDINHFFDVIPMLHNNEEVLKKRNLVFNLEDLENLYIEHILINGVLRRFINIRNKVQRNEILDKLLPVIQGRFPSVWHDFLNYYPGVTGKLKLLICFLYTHRMFALADIIWIVPKSFKNRFIEGRAAIN